MTLRRGVVQVSAWLALAVLLPGPGSAQAQIPGQPVRLAPLRAVAGEAKQLDFPDGVQRPATITLVRSVPPPSPSHRSVRLSVFLMASTWLVSYPRQTVPARTGTGRMTSWGRRVSSASILVRLRPGRRWNYMASASVRRPRTFRRVRRSAGPRRPRTRFPSQLVAFLPAFSSPA